MAGKRLPEYVQALLRKRAYGKPVQRIELIQTHVSFVFLVDEDVYKLKKRVDLGFLDFTRLENRRTACEAEVRLNQRGCPGGVYLGIETLTRRTDGYFLGGDGEVVDYLVHMKRLPRERMMDVLLARGEVDLEVIGRVAARIAALHRQADRSEEITAAGGLAQLVRNWRENLLLIRPYIGHTLSQPRFRRIEWFFEAATQREEPRLTRREHEGWVRDCHGDLRSDAICLDDSLPGGVCLYDCIEFNDAYRYSDTALDAAFLAMDLDYRGRPDLSDLFIGLYAAAIGDRELPLLLNFFKCHRALVRGKVESILGEDGNVSARKRAAARRRARDYFRLAESYTRRRVTPIVVLITGLSGSGKSVLAGAFAAHLGATLLSTDMVRGSLFERSTSAADVDSGAYTPEARDQVYAEIERLAEEAASESRPMVLDGTYLDPKHRRAIEDLARRHSLPLLLVECVASDEVILERQRRRQDQAWGTSEGNWQVYLAQKAQLAANPTLAPSQTLTVDTTAPLAVQIEAIEHSQVQVVSKSEGSVRRALRAQS